MALRVPIGVGDFRELREKGLAYVDKSHLVRAVLDKGAEAILLLRPRRFGRTLNLSMLRCFFEKREEDLSGLFSDLSIWRAGDAYRAHFQRYPTLFISRPPSRSRRKPRKVDVYTSRTLRFGMDSRYRGMLSYHDTARRPEQVYHAFVIGLLATLEPAYEVRSNRESGHGRPDVVIRPRGAGGPGVVLELKVARRGKKTLDQAIKEGIAQIREGGYAAELTRAGIAPVHALVAAFDGKRVRVRAVEAEKKAPRRKPGAGAKGKARGAKGTKRR